MSKSPFAAVGEDRRGITGVLNYALLLVIVTLVVSGLLVGVSGVVQSQQERAIRTQLDTVGNRLASGVETANRLVETSGGDRVTLGVRLPDTVAGSHYTVETVHVSGAQYRLVLRSSDPRTRRTVSVRSTVPLSGTVSGGRIVLRYDQTGSGLEVTNG